MFKSVGIFPRRASASRKSDRIANMSEAPVSTGIPKRPTSVKLATFVTGFLAILWSLVLCVVPPEAYTLSIVAPVGLLWASFISLLFFARTHVARYVTTVALAVLTIKFGFGIFLTPPNVASPRLGSLFPRIISILLAAAVASLFWRFVFGKPSQDFYRVRK
jgi:hypothetical protein